MASWARGLGAKARLEGASRIAQLAKGGEDAPWVNHNAKRNLENETSVHADPGSPHSSRLGCESRRSRDAICTATGASWYRRATCDRSTYTAERYCLGRPQCPHSPAR